MNNRSIDFGDKKFGFGAMRLPFTAEALQGSADMFDMFLENGFTYFDTAYVYGQGKSENLLKEILVSKYDRDKYTVADKLPLWIAESDGLSMEEIFNTSLSRTGLDYFDYYLIHSIDNESVKTVDKYDAWSYVQRLKAEGKVKHIGFSFHGSPDTLENILANHPEMEFVQLQINYLDWEDGGVASRRCYETARKYNKPIIVMEPVKGGTLSVVRPEIAEMLKEIDPEASPSALAIRFAASLPGVEMVLSGMSTMAHAIDNLGLMKDFKPLTQDEINRMIDIGKKIKEIPTIPCTACDYCKDGCPQNIPISRFLRFYNEYIMFDNLNKFKGNVRWMSNEKAAPDSCIGCGACESVCPQHLKIIDHLKTVSETYNK